MKLEKFLIILLALFVGLILADEWLKGQTQLSLNSQVQPAPSQIITSLYSNILPTASGMLYATLKNSATGVMTPYVLVPPGTAFIFNPSQWQAVPLSLPRGTGVTCSQVKP